MAIWRMLDT